MTLRASPSTTRVPAVASRPIGDDVYPPDPAQMGALVTCGDCGLEQPAVDFPTTAALATPEGSATALVGTRRDRCEGCGISLPGT